ncbi:MAG: hypothetical protein U0470_06010 [Anaerolineae bacterium]
MAEQPVVIAFNDTETDDLTAHHTLAWHDEMGSVFGVAADIAREQLYVGAYLKRMTARTARPGRDLPDRPHVRRGRAVRRPGRRRRPARLHPHVRRSPPRTPRGSAWATSSSRPSWTSSSR